MEKIAPYTDKEAVRDMNRYNQLIEQFNRGDMLLDEWIMAMYTLALASKTARLEYLWDGLYQLKGMDYTRMERGNGE